MDIESGPVLILGQNIGILNFDLISGILNFDLISGQNIQILSLA